jgi:hypothetical protein
VFYIIKEVVMIAGNEELLFFIKYKEGTDIKKKRNMLKTQIHCKQFKSSTLCNGKGTDMQ